MSLILATVIPLFYIFTCRSDFMGSFLIENKTNIDNKECIMSQKYKMHLKNNDLICILSFIACVK